MTRITTVTQEQVTAMVETPEARIARIARGVMDHCVFVPKGETCGMVNYPSSRDRIIVTIHHDIYGIRMEDARPIVIAIRDAPEVGDRKGIAVEGVSNWMSHILMRGADTAAHARRETYRRGLIDSVR